MPSDQAIILSAELAPDNQPAGDESNSAPEPPRSPLRKMILLGALVVALLLLGLVIFLVAKKYWPGATSPAAPNNQSAATTTASGAGAGVSSGTPAVLPDFNQPATATTTVATSSAADLAVEYLSFADFYQAPDNRFSAKINDYKLPLNVKIDVMNYYDVSRKLDLDSGLADLNNNGFALLDNPWDKETPGFYGAYAGLQDKQLPLLLTSDFLVYSYQNALKQAFKDIEANVFYDNLWDINKSLYAKARDRYEARLAAIGDVNDSILEGERLEAAFFAMALELLKPASDQTVSSAAAAAGTAFSPSEAARFSFVMPPYLRDDVLAEVKLIREGKKDKTKSPVLLYNRNYTEFSVPADYRGSAKLNNFYLTAKWLNSVFPLSYRDKDCVDCLLDAADWRVNMTAAAFMAQDFSTLPELPSKWARIYKLMSFFKGLRADLNYVHYRDSLAALFGRDYKVEELFSDKNKAAAANLEKLRQKLLTYNFPEISGGLARNDASAKPRLGFKILAEEYWPNNYIFSRLTAPSVGAYLATTTAPDNVTACVNQQTKAVNRCYGLALDAVNLVYPIVDNGYFTENTNYLNYGQKAQGLRSELNKTDIWHLNNYWAVLNFIKAGLTADKNNLPFYARSAAGRDRALNMAAGAWVNLQLPGDKLIVPAVAKNASSSALADENSYVEPNLDLINELLADDNMLLGMFSALQLDAEVRLAWQSLKDFSADLMSLKTMMVKELSGEDLSAADSATINRLAGQWQVASPPPAKQLHLKSPAQTKGWQEDLSGLKLLILVHQSGGSPVFAAGPVWDYQETP
jgi:hypothetical protein